MQTMHVQPIHFKSSPTNACQGEVTVPGDKSISHRALMLGAIAKGTTTVNGFLNGQDCICTLKAIESMGVKVEGPFGDRIIIHGVGKHGLHRPKKVIDCGNSGTSIRLLSGLLSGQVFDSILTGDASLKKRPMERISLPLTHMGAHIYTTHGYPPISIEGNQPLKGIRYEMPIASAQVKSCLLFAGMYAKGETEIIEMGISRDHTERMLTAFSYPIQKSEQSIVVNSESELIATDIIVPGDMSSAAFFIVAATIIPDSNLILRNVGINPTRTGVIDILIQMGADITLSNKRLCGEEVVADIIVKYAELEGIDIPPEFVPLAIDEFPIIFIAASQAKGVTTLTGAKELRAKESDRIESMMKGLSTLGIVTNPLEDGIAIQGGQIHGGVVDSFYDHRIAMSFAIAGCVAKSPIYIKDCNNVATSFPNFTQVANKLSLSIEEICDVSE
jgi:3-phosphoshikimate 1-carboxyvinyltransferase